MLNTHFIFQHPGCTSLRFLQTLVHLYDHSAPSNIQPYLFQNFTHASTISSSTRAYQFHLPSVPRILQYLKPYPGVPRPKFHACQHKLIINPCIPIPLPSVPYNNQFSIPTQPYLVQIFIHASTVLSLFHAYRFQPPSVPYILQVVNPRPAIPRPSFHPCGWPNRHHTNDLHTGSRSPWGRATFVCVHKICKEAIQNPEKL